MLGFIGYGYFDGKMMTNPWIWDFWGGLFPNKAMKFGSQEL
jgi:hypothetical protein